MLTVTVTPAPTLPSIVTLYLPHAPVNIRFVSIRPLSLSLRPPFSLSPLPYPFRIITLSPSMSVCQTSAGGGTADT